MANNQRDGLKQLADMLMNMPQPDWERISKVTIEELRAQVDPNYMATMKDRLDWFLANCPPEILMQYHLIFGKAPNPSDSSAKDIK